MDLIYRWTHHCKLTVYLEHYSYRGSWQDKCWTVYNDSLPLASQWQRFPAGQVLVNVQAQPSVKEAYPVPKLDTLEPLYIS